jgi:HEAT repeat protein
MSRVSPIELSCSFFRIAASGKGVARFAMSTLGVSALALSTVGCVQGGSKTDARAEFSSKERSMSGSAARAAYASDRSNPAYAPMQPMAPLDPTEVATAREILRASARAEWAALRAHAIEASVREPELLAEFAPRALADSNRGVRFVACMAIAEARATDLAELVEPLLLDESASVRAGALLALSRCGRKPDLTPLAQFVVSDDPEVRGNAYLVLGELGDASAAPMIRESVSLGMRLVNPIRVRLVGLTAAEALVKLGDHAEIEPIRAALFAPPEQAELTLTACDAIGRVKDTVSKPMLERIAGVGGKAARSPEIRLSAARALIQLGESRNLALSVAAEYANHPDPRIRAAVAALYGDAGRGAGTLVLQSLLRDADPTVQVAAAGALGEQGDPTDFTGP